MKQDTETGNGKKRKNPFALHSIRTKYGILMAALMGVMILVICLANTLYLDKYYITEKARAMETTFQQLDDMLEGADLSDADVQQNLLRLFENANISAFISPAGQDVSWQFGYGNRMEDQMKEMIYGNGLSNVDVIEQTDQYVICRWGDMKQQTGYIFFWGFMDNGDFCFLRTPLPSLRESAEISTKFAWTIGLAAIIISVLFVSILSKHISEPIIRLASIADRMAHLDFSTRYSGNREDEIAVLGESINHMSEELEKTIQNLQQVNRRLESANGKLRQDIAEKEQIDERRKEFISNVSHELKTPIALIQGYAEGLLEGISDDPESREYYCQVIVDEANKMNQLVKKLLTLNQIESGLNAADMVDFDLVPVIEGVLHSFALMIQQKEIQVTFETEKPLMVRADEFMMEEVIRNYISNAIHHIDGAKQIQILTEESDTATRVMVRNTGKPIPEESLPLVWQKFYKVDKARTREYGGSGIGLSIVKAVMDSHGGSCGVYNTEDGVCFWFELSKLHLPVVVE
jgi:signal transduction histidine kinase